jgi:Fic family protein
MKEYPVFEFLPFETLISQTQTEYYKSLTLNDKNGKSTIFIENVLDLINKSLKSLLSFNNRILNNIDRLEYFINKGAKEFTRKDYMNKYKDLSSATKTRDLKKGIDLHLFVSKGKLNRTRYTIK